MSWRTWLQATMIRLGLEEQGSVPVEVALDALSVLERRAMALRESLISTAQIRHLYVEEATAYDVARGNLFASTKAIHSELVQMGVPGSQLPIVTMLSPLPASALVGVTLAPSGANVSGSAGSLGAIRVGRYGATPGMFNGGPDTAGTLGWAVGPVIAYGALALAILGAGIGFVWALSRLLSPEVAMQESITEHDIGVAESVSAVLTEYEETRQAAIAAGQEIPPPPDMAVFGQLATGNPLVTGLSAAKGLVVALVAAAGLAIGWKIYKDVKRGD